MGLNTDVIAPVAIRRSVIRALGNSTAKVTGTALRLRDASSPARER
ncbi:hypothetical protein [Advenella sp. S44]|nr:hypothetical protein [Advenella sp. S44]